MTIAIRRIEKRWRELWDGYTRFYDREPSEAITRHTWARIMDTASPVKAIRSCPRSSGLPFASRAWHDQFRWKRGSGTAFRNSLILGHYTGSTSDEAASVFRCAGAKTDWIHFQTDRLLRFERAACRAVETELVEMAGLQLNPHSEDLAGLIQPGTLHLRIRILLLTDDGRPVLCDHGLIKSKHDLGERRIHIFRTVRRAHGQDVRTRLIIPANHVIDTRRKAIEIVNDPGHERIKGRVPITTAFVFPKQIEQVRGP